MLGEQVVEKRVLRGQTKKWTTICFDQLCSKINGESKLQTEQIAKNLQQKNIKVLSITVWRYMTRKGWKAFKRKKISLLSKR